MSAGITARFAITTPERVTFHHRPAELPLRARAWLLDQALILVLRLATVYFLAAAGDAGGAVIFVVMLGIDFGYFTFFEWRMQGQTPGKKKMRLRVATASGARLQPADLLLRNLLRPIDSLPMMNVVGGVVATLDPHRRRLGDLIAGTLVVREPDARLPRALFDGADPAHQSDGANRAYVAPVAPVASIFDADPALRSRVAARVTREERDLLLDLAARRDQIDPLPRAALFAEAAVHFRARFALPEAEHLTDERLILNVARLVCDPRPPRVREAAAAGPMRRA